MSEPVGPPSPRTTVARGAIRADYDPAVIRAILDDGLIAHVGVTTPDGPIVLPMAYGRLDDQVLLHGSVANALLRAGRSVDVCVTVTIVDGLVLARTPFHNSMNYRSVVIRGTATAIDEPSEKVLALRVINDHVARLWDNGRPPTDGDVRRTMVLSVPLTEASAKIRTGDPVDEADDLDGPWWAGTVPIDTRWGRPADSADLRGRPDVPESVAALEAAPVHRRELGSRPSAE